MNKLPITFLTGKLGLSMETKTNVIFSNEWKHMPEILASDTLANIEKRMEEKEFHEYRFVNMQIYPEGVIDIYVTKRYRPKSKGKGKKRAKRLVFLFTKNTSCIMEVVYNDT